MAIYYVLLFSSAMIWAFSFLFTKEYQRYNGDNIVSSLKLTFGANIVVALMFYLKKSITAGMWNLEFSWLTFSITLGQAFVVFLGVYIGMKVLKVGDMSIYSMFMMLGSLILPTTAGFLYGEPIDDRKIIGMVLMIVSLLMSLDSVEKKRINAKVVLYYFSAFFFNGMMGVLLTVHQKNPSLTAGSFLSGNSWIVDTDTYMIWYGLSAVIFSFSVLCVMRIAGMRNINVKQLFTTAENTETPTKTVGKIFVFLIPLWYGICLGFGDYFISLGTAPGALGSSLTFPIVNGGTILFSTIVGAIIFKEKINFKISLSLMVVICATMLFMFSPV